MSLPKKDNLSQAGSLKACRSTLDDRLVSEGRGLPQVEAHLGFAAKVDPLGKNESLGRAPEGKIFPIAADFSQFNVARCDGWIGGRLLARLFQLAAYTMAVLLTLSGGPRASAADLLWGGTTTGFGWTDLSGAWTGSPTWVDYNLAIGYGGDFNLGGSVASGYHLLSPGSLGSDRLYFGLDGLSSASVATVSLGYVPPVVKGLVFNVGDYTLRSTSSQTLGLGLNGIYVSGLNGAVAKLGDGTANLKISLMVDQTWTNENTLAPFRIDSPVDLAYSTLTVGGAGNTVMTGGLTGPGGLVKQGSGELTLAGNQTLSALSTNGLTFGGAGSLYLLSDASQTAGAGNLVLNTDATIQLGSLTSAGVNRRFTFNQLVAGTSTFSLQPSRGNGIEFTGSFNILGGGSMDLVVGAGAGYVTASNMPSGLLFSGALTGSGTLRKLGNSTVEMTNANNFAASDVTFVLGNGVLAVNSDSALGGSANKVVFSGGAFRATDSFSTSRVFDAILSNGAFEVVGGKTLTVGTLNLGLIVGLTKSDNGILELNSPNAGWWGLMTVSAGILRMGDPLAIGTYALVPGTVSASGAAVQLNGGTSGYTVNKTFNLLGTGVNSRGALQALSGGSINLNSAVSIGAAASIGADSGATLNLNGGISGGFALTFAGGGNITINSAPLGAVTSLTQINTGLTGLSVASPSFTGAMTLNNGTFLFSDAATVGGTTAITIQPTATLAIDDSVTNATRFSTRTLSLGGRLSFTGAPGATSAETLGAMTLLSGNSVVTLSTSGGQTNLTVASLGATPPVGSTMLLRGTNLGQGALTAGTATFISTGSVTFIGGTGATGTSNKGILPYILVDGSVAGYGSSFATVNSTGTALGTPGAFLRPLASNEFVTSLTAAQNVNLSTGGSQSTSIALNSLTLNGGTSLTMGGTSTLTLTSGGLLFLGNGNSISGGSLTSGTASLWVFTPTPGSVQTLSSNLIGTTNLTKSGAGTLVLGSSLGYVGLSANLLSGAVTINEGTLQLGAPNAFNYLTPQVLTVNGGGTDGLGGTLDLNGNFLVAGALSNQGAAAGANVLGGRILSSAGPTSLVSSTATSSAFAGVISGNLAFTKSGAGVLSLLADNSYTGPTVITAGGITLKDSGRLSSTSALEINFGSLILDETGLGDLSSIGRLNPSAEVTLRGATVQLAGRAQTASAQQLGSQANVVAGWNNIYATPGGTGVNSADFTVLLNRSADAVVNFASPTGTSVASGSLGNTGRVYLNGWYAGTVVNNMLGPWAVAGRDFASYQLNVGVGSLGAAGFAPYDVNTLAPITLSAGSSVAGNSAITNLVSTASLRAGMRIFSGAYSSTIAAVRDSTSITLTDPIPFTSLGSLATTFYPVLQPTDNVRITSGTVLSGTLLSGGSSVNSLTVATAGGTQTLNLSPGRHAHLFRRLLLHHRRRT